MSKIGVLIVGAHHVHDESEELIGNAAIRALNHAGYTDVITRSSSAQREAFKTALCDICSTCDLVFTAGSTGFAPEDIVPEVTAEAIDRLAPGVSEVLRSELHKHSEVSSLHRGIAGIRGRTVIINLPSSPETVKQCIEVLSLLIRPMLMATKGQDIVSGIT
jgi:molybdenum cofactor synthesis domain-containing protein